MTTRLAVYRVTVVQEVMVVCESEKVAEILGQDALLTADTRPEVRVTEVQERTEIPTRLRHLPAVLSMAAEGEEMEERPCVDWLEVVAAMDREAKARAEMERSQLPLWTPAR